jgi:CheY-like chemotaxis protein
MKKIVVVEDQQVMATIYRTKLAAEGFHVEIAADGEQGLDVVMRTKPDLVLLDLMMPKLNGIEVLKTLRSMADFKSLPIIVFSSSGNSARTDEAWRAGATMVFSKINHSPNQLIESIRTALSANAESQPVTVSAGLASILVGAPDIAGPNETAKGHVLLVEDHAVTRALLAFVLDRAEHRVNQRRKPGGRFTKSGVGKIRSVSAESLHSRRWRIAIMPTTEKVISRRSDRYLLQCCSSIRATRSTPRRRHPVPDKT